AQLRLQCLLPLLRLACLQLGDSLRESLLLREGDESGDELLGQLDVSTLVRTDAIGLLIPGFLRRFPNPGLCCLIVSLSVETPEPLQHRRPRRELGEETIRRDVYAGLNDLGAHADKPGIIFRQIARLAPRLELDEALFVPGAVLASEP